MSSITSLSAAQCTKCCPESHQKQHSKCSSSSLLPKMFTLQLLSIIVSCLMITCSGFQTVNTRKSLTATSSGRYSAQPLVTRKSQTLIARGMVCLDNTKQQNGADGYQNCKISSCRVSSSTNSRLFPQRRTASSSLMMSSNDDDVSNDESSSSSNPLVKVWLSLRKLLARFWVRLFIFMTSKMCSSGCINIILFIQTLFLHL